MKKLFVLFVMSLFVVSASFAQINKNWDGTKPEVYQGAKGFVFTYTPFQSNLGGAPAGSYSGYDISTDQILVSNLAGVGFRYFVTQNISLTGGLNFGSASQTGVDTSGFDYSSSSFGISVDGDYHFKSLYSVSPYFGVNINYGMVSNKITTKSAAAVETKVTGGLFGAGLNFGFDWYFTPGIALGGKYTLGFNSITGKERTTGSTTTTYPKGSFLGTGTGSFQLKVNF